MKVSLKGSTETLTEPLLAVAKIVSCRNHGIEALEQRCTRLDVNDRTAMVAFTTFFHILSARDVSDLDAMGGMFGDTINETQVLELPSDSVLFLRPNETMRRARCRSVRGAEKELLSAQES